MSGKKKCLDSSALRLERIVLICFVSLFARAAFAQAPVNEEQYVGQLNLNGGFPAKLLSTRSVVFHSPLFTPKELNQLQHYLQRTGIDAVAYFPLDMLTAGRDVTRGFSLFLTKREISNLLFAEKSNKGFRISITSYDGKENIVDSGQAAWSVSNRLLQEALKVLNRSALAQLKKENLLINDFPETDLTINPITGKRNEFYAIDMKVDLVAVPKFGIDSMDIELAQIFETHFPFEYKLVEPGTPERELRKQGMLYIFAFIHARAEVVRELLGYRSTHSESAYVSITYPGDQQQTKTISRNTEVYKVYFKHIDSGNVFLGNKWDADITWQKALINNIKAMKAELRLN